ncbi:pimeloyl-ACP methyl ester carboxylesterase [Kineococcus xinjiangensis]|uniref:Pimeloyl-ACP methyl ester carboxylesterase n=1 Tax=Kineococcus xinjiangensis TaxID=512762 RepID=A0A2S6IF63_9ACTN|nr:alpha/beta hydrolase [Kineococcus xinjiangensis]PPK92837.1 pimeloyl-ACP methyl ester carboxylesterase [Kineococcus xinjiangensis]
MRPEDTEDVSTVLVHGPWQHRFVSAHGARFHVAEAGEGPLVVLLHGFPQFWWAWRWQLCDLADAGYRAVAMDLRGYGASDKPPRGYDTATSAADVAAVIRALGESEAFVVGHGLGGRTAWAMPALTPRLVRGVAVLGAAHPLLWRSALLDLLRAGDAGRRALAALAASQVPSLPERELVTGEGVQRVLTSWSAPGWPDEETLQRYRSAMRVPFVAHSASEYHRWIVRSPLREEGRRFAAALRRPVEVPVLQLHGRLDPTLGAETVWAASDLVAGPHRVQEIDGAGHFLPEEASEHVSAALLSWLARW